MTPGPDRPRPAVRLSSIVVRHGGDEWERDLTKCRVAVTMRQIEGKFGNVEDLAAHIGLNAKTVRRWLRGVGPGSDETTTRILAGLELKFGDVHRKVQAGTEESGPAVPTG